MKKLVIGLLGLSVLASCGKTEDIYLYDNDSPYRQNIETLGTAQCAKKAKIFDFLDAKYEIPRWNSNQVNTRDIIGLTVTQTGSSDVVGRLYVKFLTSEATNESMTLAFRGSGLYAALDQKKLTISSNQQKEILETIQNGTCHPQKYYDHNGLNRERDFRFTHRRSQQIGSNEQHFMKVDETFFMKYEYPLLINIMATNKVKRSKLTDAAATSTTITSNLSHLNVQTCESDDRICNFNEASNFSVIDLAIDTDAYIRQASDATIYQFVSGNVQLRTDLEEQASDEEIEIAL